MRAGVSLVLSMSTCPIRQSTPPHRKARAYSQKISISDTSILRPFQGRGMADTGDALPLLGGGGGEQGPGAAEEQLFPAPLAHPVEDQPAEHHGGAAAARSAAVYVLLLRVVDEHAAVLQVGQLHPVPVK